MRTFNGGDNFHSSYEVFLDLPVRFSLSVTVLPRTFCNSPLSVAAVGTRTISTDGLNLAIIAIVGHVGGKWK